MTSTIGTNGATTLTSAGDAWKASPNASDDTKHLGARAATVHSCSRSLTYGHPFNIWSPGTMRWMAAMSRDFVRAAAERPKYAPKSPHPMGDIQLKATWGVFCKTVVSPSRPVAANGTGTRSWAPNRPAVGSGERVSAAGVQGKMP